MMLIMSYTEALLSFRAGPGLLEDAVEGASDTETAFVPAPGKWNIRQILRHVADTEIVVGMRMRQIIAEDKPTLAPFDQDAWAEKLGYEKAGALDSLAKFRSNREDTAALLESLPAEAFERVSFHPERGTKSLLEWVRLFSGHVEKHAEQIRSLRAAAKNA
jgi:hypothetical protein